MQPLLNTHGYWCGILVLTCIVTNVTAQPNLGRLAELGIQLVRAAKKGQDASRIRQLLDQGTPVDFQEPNLRFSALHWAAREHRTEMVQILLSAGASVNIRNYFDTTPLMDTAMHRDTTVMDLLLTAGAIVNCQDRSGNTPLTLSVLGKYSKKDFVTLERLLAAGAREMINHQNKDGSSVLGRIALHLRGSYPDCLYIIKQLLAAGAIDLPDNCGRTLLTCAANAGRQDILQCLLLRDMRPTAEQLQKLKPHAKTLIEQHLRAQAVRAWALTTEQQKQLPRDLTRLIWKIGGEMKQYMPKRHGCSGYASRVKRQRIEQ